MRLLKKNMERYQSILRYLFFGVCTTLINFVLYYFCAHLIAMGTVFATIFAWIGAVLFAFITNKLYVFSSRSFERKVLLWELLSFFGCRIATGILDLLVMYVSVEIMHMQDLLMKIISNVLVILLNYIFSRWIIFKH